MRRVSFFWVPLLLVVMRGQLFADSFMTSPRFAMNQTQPLPQDARVFLTVPNMLQVMQWKDEIHTVDVGGVSAPLEASSTLRWLSDNALTEDRIFLAAYKAMLSVKVKEVSSESKLMGEMQRARATLALQAPDSGRQAVMALGVCVSLLHREDYEDDQSANACYGPSGRSIR
jgi:hypothetical protein